MRIFPKTAYGNIAAAFAAFLCGCFFAKESLPVVSKIFLVYAGANVIYSVVRFFRWLNNVIDTIVDTIDNTRIEIVITEIKTDSDASSTAAKH